MHDRKTHNDCINTIIKKAEHYEVIVTNHSREHIKNAYKWGNIKLCLVGFKFASLLSCIILMFVTRSLWSILSFIIPTIFVIADKFIDSDEESKLHMDNANHYISIKNEIRLFICQDINHMDEIEALARMATITTKVKRLISCALA